MNLFVQGMRRSGTTIVYDALLEDGGLRCLYEPFTSDKAAIGGGSGVRGDDLFADVRALRERFRRERRPGLDTALLNHGAPRAPELELEPDLPDHCRDYLRFLLDQAPDNVVKEVRLYRKLPVVAEISPGARLLHVVRDPRAVATSIMLGRGRKRAHLFQDPDAFFTHRSQRALFASRSLSEALLRRPEHRHLRGCPDLERILLVWRFTFEHTRRDGLRCFGDRYRSMRHEDLAADPAGEVRAVYELLDRPAPPRVLEWARRNVSVAQDAFAPGDPRWSLAAARVGLEASLREAGYEPRAAAV
jgi:sulfotransferase family protein